MLTFLLGPALDFIKANYVGLIVGTVLLLLFMFSAYVALTSVRRLKTEVTPFYPFDVFFPQGGAWSVGYFLIAIVVLTLLIYFMVKGGFYLSPA